MKGLITLVALLILSVNAIAQKNCITYNNYQKEIKADPGFIKTQEAIEEFTRSFLGRSASQARLTSTVIKIPVVVHVLYHFPSQKISDDIINTQIKILNRDFRRRNADTSLTPVYFRNIAADCEIEFQLATSDPQRFSTNGIIKKYTPVTSWEGDDKMKFNSEMGDDGWNPKNYLNIWVCSLNRVAGYSSLPGCDPKKDGIVIDFSAFGMTNTSGYGMGRTAVHEIGHWLNLKHIWGDSDCGDDNVEDTPKQETYSVECPTGIHVSCNNGPNGDMYMNYMDMTDDQCMNLFTLGQKARMRSLFTPGGPRESLLYSTGLLAPLIVVQPIQLPDPAWLFTKIYPNPVTDQLNINVEYDTRWLGKIITVNNLNGQAVMHITISSASMQADLSKLRPGVYFLTARKEDGETIRHKFIKM